MKKCFLKTLPVMAGYIVLGAGFGIVLNSHGYGVLWALFASTFIYAGSMQFVAVDLIASGAGLLSAALTTLLVNARHLFYGVSMVDRYRDMGKAKPYLIFALTDETYSLVVSDDSLTKREYFLISLFDQLYWISGSVFGALIGALIPWDFNGVDFALTALFVTVFTEQCLSSKDWLPGIIGLSASVLSLLVFKPDRFLIPAMLLISVSLCVLNAVRKKARHE